MSELTQAPGENAAKDFSQGVDVPRVLLISDRYFPHVGGSIHWFHNIYTRRPPGTVSILTQSYANQHEFDDAHPTIEMVRRDLKRYPFLKPESRIVYLKLLWTGSSLIRKRGIQLIHASKVLPEGYVARILSKWFKIPYVPFAHGEEITIFGKNAKQRKHLPKVYDDAAAVIANSRSTVDQIRELGCHARNVVRISPGVDPDVFHPTEKDGEIIEKLDLADKKVILSVGRLTKRKGHDHVIDALPAVLEKHPDVVYVILSTGEEDENLRRRAKERGVEANVRFVGEVPYDHLPRYYNTCDVFVMANRTLPDGDMEGFGIVYLEANACAKPVIAGDSGGTGDPVRDGTNGYRVDATEPQNIAGALLTMFAEPDRCVEMGRAGRQIVEEEYAWDRVIAKIEELCAAVVAGRPLEKNEALESQV